MFTDEQKKELAAKLDRSHVAERKQGGKMLSYIEGWWAISEANRIFGFDGWTRETVELRMVSERERKIGTTQTFVGHPGWGVTYVARVKVTIIGKFIIREGSGAGHGIDRDLGAAHESALKEAETDAMKRALMTFGNPFGLALYDKSQGNVVDGPPTADPEGDALIGEEQVDRILELIAQTNSNAEAFCKYMGISDVTTMPQDLYRKALESLEHKLKRGK